MVALADVLASPSRYMLAYFQQRGWALPLDSRVIPNVLPPAEPQQPAPAAAGSPGQGNARWIAHLPALHQHAAVLPRREPSVHIFMHAGCSEAGHLFGYYTVPWGVQVVIYTEWRRMCPS